MFRCGMRMKKKPRARSQTQTWDKPSSWQEHTGFGSRRMSHQEVSGEEHERTQVCMKIKIGIHRGLEKILETLRMKCFSVSHPHVALNHGSSHFEGRG